MVDSRGRSWTSLRDSRRSLVKSAADYNSPIKRRIWGRRIGRPLKRDRLEAMEKLLPVIKIPLEKLTAEKNIDPASLFDKKFNSYWFEIGFGDGAHLVTLKRNYNDVGFLGAEPFINGVSALTKSLSDDPLDNIRILSDDALLLTRSLTDNSIERIYILNPDPWPKTRHHKRRIVSLKNLDEFARIMKPGGKLVLATDVDDLAEWMVTECSNHSDFEWMAENAKDWQTPPEEWIETKYAFKGKQAGRRQTFLVFKRLAKKPE